MIALKIMKNALPNMKEISTKNLPYENERTAGLSVGYWSRHISQASGSVSNAEYLKSYSSVQ